MAKLKLFSIIFISTFILLNSSACTKEKLESAEINKSAKIENIAAANLVTQPKVIDIASVKKGTKGKAVDFTWVENGKTYSFAEVTKGKVVFLNFWATWCGPCKMEIPDIIKINEELSNDDFVVIGINTDRGKSLEQIRSMVQGFAKAKKINYINFLLTQNIVDPYGGISGIPTTFIIDRQGNISEKIVGARSKADFMKSINRVL